MKRFINDMGKYWEYAKYSAKSSLKSEIANSHLSWLWWILDPLLFMLVYSFVAIIVFGKENSIFRRLYLSVCQAGIFLKDGKTECAPRDAEQLHCFKSIYAQICTDYHTDACQWV